MLTREQFLDLCRNEVLIIKHLHTKVNPDNLNYRPTPGQRNTGEVLENLPCNLALIADCFIKSNFEGFKPVFEQIQASVKKDFSATMDAEMDKLAALVMAIPEAEFQNKELVFPTGHKIKLGPGLVGSVYRFIVAYKMQLFLYLKAAGRTELNSSNLWMGVDPQPKAK